MIVILGHLELDVEVSDTDMETVESDDCRAMSKNNRDANGVLAMICEGARFFWKNEQKFINLFTQLISGLCQMS